MLLRELVLRLQKAEMKYKFILHMVHVAGTWAIQQGTDGLSQARIVLGRGSGQTGCASICQPHALSHF
jgi:hypothetical protein